MPKKATCSSSPLISKKVVADVLGNLRLKIGRDLGLIDDNVFKFAWVVDFPLLGYDEEEKRYVAEHHPFTRPKEEICICFDTDPAKSVRKRMTSC